jgi:hypothetical protein
LSASIPFFVRTQSAIQTPFDNSTNGFTATEVQSAIEEAQNNAFLNDRFALWCSYGGNAANRYLELFAGINMLEAPFLTSFECKLIGVVIRATATTNGTVAWYDLTSSTTVPKYSLGFNNSTYNVANGTFFAPLYIFPPGAQIAVRIESTSVLKPHVYFFLSGSN